MKSVTITVSKENTGTRCHTFVRTIELVSGDNKTWKENTNARMGNWGDAFKAGVLEALANGRSVKEFRSNSGFSKQKDRYRFDIVANA
jgi:hypothetical protein